MENERDAGRLGIPDEPRRIRDGGPAFPYSFVTDTRGFRLPVTDGGMSLRDWFAGQALAGLCANPDIEPGPETGKCAYALADQMLAERGQ